jgi:hypothetical protein
VDTELIIQLEVLEIVGYADQLTPEALPSLVTPVFRLKSNPERFLFPPFRLDAQYVYNGTWDGPGRWDSLVKTGNMTSFESPISAKHDFQLWIDEQNRPQYSPRAQAHADLEAISNARVEQAKQALMSGDLNGAEQLATQAFNADDRSTEALVVKGAIRKRLGKDRNLAFLVSLAHGVSPQSFMVLIDMLLNSNPLQNSPVSGVCKTKRESATQSLFPVAA